MPFGLKNAPAVFQRFINELLRNLIDVLVIVHLDNILIYSKDCAEHIKTVQEVLRQLKENHLFLKLLKCKFFTEQVTFIGLVITPMGVSMESEKIKAVVEWPVPKT